MEQESTGMRFNQQILLIKGWRGKVNKDILMAVTSELCSQSQIDICQLETHL